MLHEDKRSFRRVSLDALATITTSGEAQPQPVLVKDLSAGGALLWADAPMREGSELELTVSPENPITPPMTARLRVVRCSQRENATEAEGKAYALACEMAEVVW